MKNENENEKWENADYHLWPDWYFYLTYTLIVVILMIPVAFSIYNGD